MPESSVKMMKRSAALLLALPFILAPALRAQLVVRVESNGAAVFGAEVTVWSDSGRLAAGRTDGAGIVRLPVASAKTPIAFITARRVGFAPGRISLPAADSVTIWLTRRTAKLSTVAVSARPLRCPAQSEEEARTLWRRAAARYAAGQDTMPWSYLATSAEETVHAAERGFGEALAQRPPNVIGWDRGVRLYGNPLAFVFGTYHPPFGPAYEKWTYPVMFGAAAGLFASAYFGEQHTFVVLGRSGDATTLGFCARSRSEPEIEGELQVSSDTLLLGARWSFRMPHHDEDAGGEATFGEAHLGSARFLVAVNSSTWHRVRPDLYQQQRHLLKAWKVGYTKQQSSLGGWGDRGDRSGTP